MPRSYTSQEPCIFLNIFEMVACSYDINLELKINVFLGEITSDVLRVVSEARAGSLGPFSPSFNIQNVLLEGMQKYLPHDVHKIVSGKLHISLTRVYDGQNVIVSDFPTREDLLQVSNHSLSLSTAQKSPLLEVDFFL